MQRFKRWDYTSDGIDEESLPDTPWGVISAWVEDARGFAAMHPQMPEPDAISIGTVDPDGRPRVRTVLMRHLGTDGPGFYTNLDSRKGRALRHDPRIAATLTWPSMFRAVRFVGEAHQMPRDQVREYFQGRPWGSRIGAWASHQSQPVPDRAVLEARVRDLERRWPDHGDPQDVPLPDFWGGYVIDVSEVELWAGRRSRLHDRVVYRRDGHGDLATGTWHRERLQP